MPWLTLLSFSILALASGSSFIYSSPSFFFPHQAQITISSPDSLKFSILFNITYKISEKNGKIIL